MLTESRTDKACDSALCRLAEGDTEALTVIYNTMKRRIFMLAFSILREESAAEDVMQDTFLKLATEAHAYRPGSNAVAFILTVTRNLSVNLLHKRRREIPCAEIGEDMADAAEPDPRPFHALEALSLLDESDRIIVILKLDCGMKHRAIGAFLGISEDACRKRYKRALNRLKTYYRS